MSGGSVLYVTYDGLLEPLGSSQVVPVVEGLAAMGFDMEVLSFEKPEDLSSHAAVRAMADRLSGSGVRWSRARYHARPSVPATALDIVTGIRRVRKAARKSDRLLVHARSYVPAIMAWRGISGTRARFLFDMRGFWVDERIEAGRWEAGSHLVKWARRAERRLLASADHLVHLTRAGEENVSRLAPDVTLPESEVIPTCVDMGRFKPSSQREDLRSRLGVGPGPVIIHIGTLSGWYLGEQTFKVGKAFVRRTGGEFVVMTREVELAQDLAGRVGVAPRILSAPYDEVPQWLAASDVGLSLVRPGFAKTASAPTKVGEYLACGLAVVSTRGVGDLDAHFEGSPVACTMSPDEDPDRVVEWIERTLALADRAGSARALAKRYYDLEAGIEAYARVYRGLGVTPCT